MRRRIGQVVWREAIHQEDGGAIPVNAVPALFTIEPDRRPPDTRPSGDTFPFLNSLIYRSAEVVSPAVPDAVSWPTSNDAPADILSSVDSARLVSDAVRDIVSSFDTGEIAWLPARVVTPSGDSLRYWLVHYPNPRDVLNPELSRFGPGGPIRWVVDLAQVQELPVFMIPGLVTETFIVHPEVRRALVESEVTGMESRPTRT
jgi:hypothetical protein